jgi:signal transduction histidine kinase
MRHLVDNAIKFTKDHGSQVEITLTRDDGHVAITVTDDGIGVSPKEHEWLFDMFYQSNRDKLEQPGTGVGLAIVKHIADLHGGHVDLDSQPGKGAVFTLYLPVS